jgi:hypothetical protein
MSDVILDAVSANFPYELGELTSFSEVCSDLEDEEAVQSTAPFFGISWMDVASERWRLKPSALTFFTPRAMRYYLPSLIKCSLENPENTELAVDGLIFELEEAAMSELGRWRDSRWSMLSVAQTESVLIWLHSLEGSEGADFDRRVATAIETLRRLQRKERDMEAE